MIRQILHDSRRRSRLPGAPPRTLHRERGSTFIVVLSILSLLVLVATALSLTSRLEVISSANYAEGIQARMAAKSGLTLATARAAFSPEALSTQRASDSNRHLLSAPTGTVDLRSLASLQRISLADVWSLDACARLNLNTADQKTLARFFRHVADQARVTDGNPDQLAAAVVEFRERSEEKETPINVYEYLDQATKSGRLTFQDDRSAADLPVSAPIEAALPDLRKSDLRVTALEGQSRFQSARQLLDLPGASPALVGAAAPYLTVFSSSRQTAELPGGSRNPLDLNTAEPADIVSILSDLYAGSAKQEDLLRQFAVNLVDWRDTDRIPTQYPGSTGTQPILGLERTPFISEVWPNSIYPEETRAAGQYLELYNPWADSVDLTGWSLSIGGQRIPLRGFLTPGGYLVVTDVYDGLDSTKQVEGPFDSFYTIFGAVENGTTRRILEASQLSIPWVQGQHRVDLLDEAGNLIDVFSYTVRAPLRGQKTSFQRRDVRVRVVETAACTPFAPMPRLEPFLGDADSDSPPPADRPFLSATEVLTVYAGWAGMETPEEGDPDAYPVLAVPGTPDEELSSLASASDRLDARLLDVFTVEEQVLWAIATGEDPESLLQRADDTESPATGLAGLTGQDTTKDDSAPADTDSIAQNLDRLAQRLPTQDLQQAFEEALAANDTKTLASLAQRAFLALSPGTVLGRVNLNTAPRVVLASLPGMTDTIADRWTTSREDLWGRRARYADPVNLFRRPSDLLADRAFWEADSTPEARYRRLTFLLPTVTFSTSSVFMDSRTAVAEPLPTQTRKPTQSRAMALVAFDRGEVEFVAWSQTP